MRVIAGLLLLLFLMPAGSLIVQGFSVTDTTFSHLVDTVLGGYVWGTLALMALVMPGVLLLGTTSAWLVARCAFPGRRLLGWALLLPFAAPPYVLAYVYTDALQDVMPNIRSLPAAAALFSFVLYPYVYLLARASFLEQATRVSDAARMLGCSPLASFFRVALPLARPSLVAGTAMALMEVAADFGTVEYFAIDTFSTGVYRTWFALGSKAGAARLALVLLVVAFALLCIEKVARRRARYFGRGQTAQEAPLLVLRGARGMGAAAFCVFPVCVGFVLPVGLLAQRLVKGGWHYIDASFFAMASRSFALALAAGVFCCAAGALLAWTVRYAKGKGAHLALNAASLGYAMPGSVLAVGVLYPLAQADAFLGDLLQKITGQETGLLLSGTVGALVFAYVVRFGAIPLQGLQAALDRVTPTLERSARMLGSTRTETLTRVFIPAIRSSLLAAVVLVFVDVVKELPATLLLRPFNFDTLAVHTYHLASDERLTEASPAALLIVLVGVLPVTLLHGISARRSGRTTRHRPVADPAPGLAPDPTLAQAIDLDTRLEDSLP